MQPASDKLGCQRQPPSASGPAGSGHRSLLTCPRPAPGNPRMQTQALGGPSAQSLRPSPAPPPGPGWLLPEWGAGRGCHPLRGTDEGPSAASLTVAAGALGSGGWTCEAGAGAHPRPWAGGPLDHLDDGALLPEGAAGAGPGQQQLLLLHQAVQQVLLAVAVVDSQESQRGGGQPGQPRGPEAKLHRAGRGSGAGQTPSPPLVPLPQGKDGTPGEENGGRVLGSTFFLPPAATAARPWLCCGSRASAAPALAPRLGHPLSSAGQWQSSPSASSWATQPQGELVPNGASCSGWNKLTFICSHQPLKQSQAEPQ